MNVRRPRLSRFLATLAAFLLAGTLAPPCAFAANTARLRSAQVLPSGNIVCCLFERNSDSTLTAVTTLNSYPTITINGGSPITLSGDIWRTTDPYIWFPLNVTPTITLKDDSEGTGIAKTGTWGTSDFSGGGHSNILYQDNCSNSNDPTATITYTIAGLPSGVPLRASITLNNIASLWSTNAQYVLKDGATVLATVHVNQTTVPQPFDRPDVQLHWADLGSPVTLSGTTLTVVISNAAGSGYLFADAIRVESLPPRIVQPSDTVTITASDGWVTTAAGTVGASSAAMAPVLTDSQWFPYDAAAPRTMGLGYNLGEVRADFPNHVYANRARCSINGFGNGGWYPANGGSSVTLDSNGELTAITGTAKIGVMGETANGADTWCFPGAARTGTWTVKYYSPGSPTIGLSDESSSGGIVIGSRMTQADDPVTGKHVFTQVVTFADPDTFNPDRFAYTQPLGLAVSGAIATQVEVLGPEIPSNWSSKFHPSLFTRLQGKGFKSIRTLLLGMGDGSTNNSKIVNYADLPTVDHVSTMFPTFSYQANVASIDPVDLTMADTDDALKWFSWDRGGVAIIKVTTTADHHLTTGMCPLFDSGTAGPFADTGGGNTSIDGAGAICVVTGPRTFLWHVTTTSPTPGGSPPTVPFTLSGSHTPGGRVFVQGGYGMPIPDIIQLCNELMIDPWINVGYMWTDDCVTQVFQYIAGHLNAGLKCRVEYSNEVWNTGQGFNQTTYADINGHYVTSYLFANSLPGGYFAPTGRHWYPIRMGQVNTLAMAAWTATGAGPGGITRPASGLIRVMGAQAGGPPTTQTSAVIADGYSPRIVFDELAIDTYQDIDSLNNALWTGGANSNPNISYEQCSIDDLIDIYGLYAQYSGRASITTQHRAFLDASGYQLAGATPVKIVSYEGGPQNLCPYGADFTRALIRAWKVNCYPRFGRAMLAENQYLQSLGYTLRNFYTLDQPNGMGVGKEWRQYPALDTVAGVGDGSDSKYDNRLNAWDLRRAVSVTGHASIEWAADSGGSPGPHFRRTPTGRSRVGSRSPGSGDGGY